MIFTAHQTLDQARSFYRTIRERVASHERDPDHVKVMPGVFTVVGESQQHADDIYGELQALVDPVVGLGLLSDRLGVDTSKFPLDEPLPPLPETEGSISRQRLVAEQARREGLTVRQLYLAVTGGRGHRFLIGTAATIADGLEEWFLGEGADGFNVMPAYLPDQLGDFVDRVVPELQRRGLFRHDYQGRTLRDHLELPRPAHPAAHP